MTLTEIAAPPDTRAAADRRNPVAISGRPAAWRLPLLTAGLMVVASLWGLGVDDLYREPAGLREMLQAYDLVVLVLVAPIVAGGALLMRHGSLTGRLVCGGGLAFAVYDYAIYVFGTAFNAAFLLHAAVFAMSVAALTAVLRSTAAREVGERLDARSHPRLAAGLLAFLAVGLAGMWIYYSIRFAVTGDRPEESELVLPIASMHLAYALDLTVIAPAYAAAAVLLWRRAAWGFVLAPILLVGGIGQQIAYMAALAFQSAADVPGATAFDPGEPVVVLAYVVALWAVLRGIRSPRPAR